MKKILFVALAFTAFFAVASCSKSSNQVLVRFQNTIDQDITDAVYAFDDTHQTSLGLLPAGATSDYFPFEYFKTGDGVPSGILTGAIGDSDFSAFSGHWCGTGVTYSQLEPGQYTIIISEVDPGKGGYYRIKFSE